MCGPVGSHYNRQSALVQGGQVRLRAAQVRRRCLAPLARCGIVVLTIRCSPGFGWREIFSASLHPEPLGTRPSVDADRTERLRTRLPAGGRVFPFCYHWPPERLRPANESPVSLRGFQMVGGTGLEPVTPSLSSRGNRPGASRSVLF